MLWADLLVALACAATVPGASRWLPLVPLILLLPHLADRFVRALPYPYGAQFVPDPLASDWPQLARGVATLGLQAGATGTPQTLRLAPFYHPDGRARPYQLDYLPQSQTLRIGEPAGPRPHDARLPYPLRPRLPLPVVVGDQPVTLRIAQLASDDRHPPLALFQCAQDPLTQGFLLPLALPLLLLLPCSWRVSLVAAIALLAPGRDLSQYKGVALQRRRVVGFEMPDVGPDRLGLLRRGESSEPAPELGDRVVEALVDGAPAGSSSGHRAHLPTPGSEVISRPNPESNLSTPPSCHTKLAIESNLSNWPDDRAPGDAEGLR